MTPLNEIRHHRLIGLLIPALGVCWILALCDVEQLVWGTPSSLVYRVTCVMLTASVMAVACMSARKQHSSIRVARSINPPR
jgi:hypothetical protein